MKFLLRGYPAAIFVPLLLLALLPAQAPLPLPEPLNPDYLARLAARHKSDYAQHRAFGKDDLPYIVHIDWLGVPQAKLANFKRVMNWWLNQMSWERDPAQLQDVPGSAGRLQWLDLRNYRWSLKAWTTVAGREFFRQEPWIDDNTAQAVRDGLGVKPDPKLTKKDIFPVFGLMWAPWLFRETIESDRSPSYYDLLFARQRFGKQAAKKTGKRVKRTRTVYHSGGDYTQHPDGHVRPNLPAGTYTIEWYDTVEGGHADAQAFKDFPKDVDEWNSAFGIDVSKAFARKEDILNEFGAVVEGGRDDPKRGSIVALNNRFLVTTPTPISAAMQSFDVFETRDDRDFVEESPVLPFKLRTKGVKFDAGELLAYLPNGGQAGFLINAEGKRVEVAVKAVDGRGASSRLTPGVRNPGDCVACHASSGGYILPNNLIKQVLDGGVDLYAKDRRKAIEYRGFFLGWERRVKAIQDPYLQLILETTRAAYPSAYAWEAAFKREDWPRLHTLLGQAETAKRDKGWTGSQLETRFKEFRDWYDDPVTPEQAAAETGVPLNVFKLLCATPAAELKKVKGQVDLRTARISMLARGMTIPRRAWETRVFRQVSLILAAQREKKK